MYSVPMDRFPARRLDNSARRVRNPHDGRIFSTAEEPVYSTACPAFYLPDRRDFSVTAYASSIERRDGDGNPTMKRSTDKRVFYENLSPDHDQPYSANRLGYAA